MARGNIGGGGSCARRCTIAVRTSPDAAIDGTSSGGRPSAAIRGSVPGMRAGGGAVIGRGVRAGITGAGAEGVAGGGTAVGSAGAGIGAEIAADTASETGADGPAGGSVTRER